MGMYLLEEESTGGTKRLRIIVVVMQRMVAFNRSYRCRGKNAASKAFKWDRYLALEEMVILKVLVNSLCK